MEDEIEAIFCVYHVIIKLLFSVLYVHWNL